VPAEAGRGVRWGAGGEVVPSSSGTGGTGAEVLGDGTNRSYPYDW
jgi:hypothetical protein